MIKRYFPQPKNLAPLLKFKKPELDGKRRRLAAAVTIDDLRTIAKKRTPKAPFDYTDGAAEGELSIARARQAFQDIEFHPSILRDVTRVDRSGLPVLAGPVEATAIGNVLIQAHTQGFITGDLETLRGLLLTAFPPISYLPTTQGN